MTTPATIAATLTPLLTADICPGCRKTIEGALFVLKYHGDVLESPPAAPCGGTLICHLDSITHHMHTPECYRHCSGCPGGGEPR